MRLLTGETLRACGVRKSDRVLTGLSGGADSTALLLSLAELAREGEIAGVFAAHLNHGIRGGEAEEDQRFCEALCMGLGVPFYAGRADVPALAGAAGETLEQAARNARYAFLRRTAGEAGADCIAVAHHREDQAETLLMHLFRGSGLPGLTGMRSRSGDLIRPLLTVSRAQIEAYLAERSQPYRTDSTNGDPAYTRNRIRAALQELGLTKNGGTERLCQAAALLQRDEDYLEGLSREAEQSVFTGDGLDRTSLAALPEPIRGRILRRAVLRLGPDVTGADIRRLNELLSARTGTRIELRKGMSAWVDGQCLYLGEYPEAARFEIPFVREGITEFPGGRLESAAAAVFLKPADGSTAYLDGEKLPEGLVVRTRRNGDRFHPLGAPGDRKLSDYMTDRKIPLTERDMPLLAAGERVYYVAGYTVAEEARVTEHTKQMVRIAYMRG